MLSIVLWALAALFVCGAVLVLLCCCYVASIADEQMEQGLRQFTEERMKEYGNESRPHDD